MKHLLITHNDLDWFWCQVVVKYAYDNFSPNIKLDMQIADHRSIDSILKEQEHRYDRIYITDICPSIELVEKYKDKIIILDHHKSSERIKEIKWLEHSHTIRWCWAKICMEYFWQHRFPESLVTFIYAIDAWDTRKLWTQYRKIWEQLNSLFTVYRSDFYNKYLVSWTYWWKHRSSFILTDEEEFKADAICEVYNDMKSKAAKEPIVISYRWKIIPLSITTIWWSNEYLIWDYWYNMIFNPHTNIISMYSDKDNDWFDLLEKLTMSDVFRWLLKWRDYTYWWHKTAIWLTFNISVVESLSLIADLVSRYWV